MKKGQLSTIILIVILIAGLSLLLYPTVSDYWNSFHQSKAITEYAEQVADMNEETYKRLLAEARSYNEALLDNPDRYHLTEEEEKEYESLLNVAGNGIMGYIEIPKINCQLPIYHGVDEAILQVAVGHIAGSSLPTGGAGTHCAISGHRGLPSARLFTDLDKLTEGDIFLVRVLDETLTYEVDQMLIVKPDDTEALEIEEDKDYFTLITCTPYGINSHRLLVRGHRIGNQKESGAIRVTADAMPVDERIVAVVLASAMLLVLLAVLMVRTRRRGK